MLQYEGNTPHYSRDFRLVIKRVWLIKTRKLNFVYSPEMYILVGGPNYHVNSGLLCLKICFQFRSTRHINSKLRKDCLALFVQKAS